MGAREARLKAEYQEWYPKISHGVWHNASWLTEMVLQQQRRGSPLWTLEGRPLSDAHFEFRGYEPRRNSTQPRRTIDASQ